jgi:hypothetical protein
VTQRLRLWLEAAAHGYRLRDAATGEPVRWEDERTRVVAAAGVSYRPDALPDPSFDPGKRLALVPEPATSLWRVDGGLRVLIVSADPWVGLPR